MRMVNCRLLHIGIQLKNWNLETCVPVSHFLSRKSINKCSGFIVDAIMNKTCLDHMPGLYRYDIWV